MYWELSVKLMTYQIMLKCGKIHASRLHVYDFLPFDLFYEPRFEKMSLMTYAPSKDLDQCAYKQSEP